jgi:hypothetical protein
VVGVGRLVIDRGLHPYAVDGEERTTRAAR